MTLDVALGGGYPKGRVIEIYGPESSGKTTLALHALAEVQKSGGIHCCVHLHPTVRERSISLMNGYFVFRNCRVY